MKSSGFETGTGVMVEPPPTGVRSDANKPQMVLLGGMGSHVHSLRGLNDALAERGHEVWRVDVTRARKIGHAALFGFGADIASYASHALETMRQEVGPSYVVGHSWGGVLALMTALQDRTHSPSRQPIVKGLALMNTIPGYPAQPPDPMTAAYLNSAHTLDRQQLANMYGGVVRHRPELIDQLGLYMSGDDESMRIYRMLQSTASSSFMQIPFYLHRIQQPTLVIAGTDDPIAPQYNGEWLAGQLPRARLHVIKGGGHMEPMTNPEAVASLVDAHYVDSLKPGGPTSERIA